MFLQVSSPPYEKICLYIRMIVLTSLRFHTRVHMHMPDHPTVSLDMRVLLFPTRGRNKLLMLGYIRWSDIHPQ
jgi:hypothetical protein